MPSPVLLRHSVSFLRRSDSERVHATGVGRAQTGRRAFAARANPGRRPPHDGRPAGRGHQRDRSGAGAVGEEGGAAVVLVLPCWFERRTRQAKQTFAQAVFVVFNADC